MVLSTTALPLMLYSSSSSNCLLTDFLEIFFLYNEGKVTSLKFVLTSQSFCMQKFCTAREATIVNVSNCISVYKPVYTCMTYTDMFTCTHTCIHACGHIMHAHTHVHIHTHTHTHTHTHMQKYAHTCITFQIDSIIMHVRYLHTQTYRPGLAT